MVPVRNGSIQFVVNSLSNISMFHLYNCGRKRYYIVGRYQWSGGHPRSHNLASYFPTQSHPRRDFPESPAHTDWSHKYTQAQFSHGIGWGGVGWGWWHSFALAHLCDSTLWAHITRVQSATEWTASVHTLHMSTCNVTRVQSAAQWTASVHTLHMSKPVM